MDQELKKLHPSKEFRHPLPMREQDPHVAAYHQIAEPENAVRNQKDQRDQSNAGFAHQLHPHLSLEWSNHTQHSALLCGAAINQSAETPSRPYDVENLANPLLTSTAHPLHPQSLHPQLAQSND